MKRTGMNIYQHMLRTLCVALMFCMGGVSLQAQTLTRNGIVEDDYQWVLGNDLPSDFYEAIFDADGVPIMDVLIVISYLEGIPEDMGMPDGKYASLFMNMGDSYMYGMSAPMSMLFLNGSLSGQKVYMTGTCDDAYAGEGTETEGFLYITGNEGETADLYLHDCNIKTKSKELPGQSVNQWLKGYILGSASPIAIGSTSLNTDNPFTVNIHIRGDNKLTGGATSKLKATGSTINDMLADILYLSAAPIAIRPIPELPDEGASNEVIATGLERYRNIATKLVFDDVWPTAADGSTTIRTNGLLELPVVGDLGAPSIDLGNSKGQVDFNGGEYKFHTPRTNSMFYVSSLAICYRSIRLAGFETIGTGSSMSAGTSSEEVGTSAVRDVVINDGTFSTYPAEKVAVTPTDPTVVDVVGKGWYVDYTDLRLPYNARIYGGTFNNCEVYRCDGSGEQGVPPMYVNPLDASDEKTQCRVKTEINPAEIVNDVYTGAALEAGYGSASLMPIKEADGKYYVYPYLTTGCEATPPVYSRNWVTLIPKMGIEGFLTMGGDQTVYDKTLDSKDLTNKYLFYARLNDYTKRYASIKLAGFDVEVQQAIDMITGSPGSANYKPELEFSGVTNSDSYRIEQALYTMLSFPSNEWQLISLPYDVHRVWVLETTGDDQIRPGETLENFLIRQGKADGNLAQNIVTSLCPDIFSGKGSGVNMNLIDIATTQIDCPPFELTHYDGSNANKANYYLYEQVNETDSEGYGGDDKVGFGIGLWHLQSAADGYSNKWKLASNRHLNNADGQYYKDLKGEDVPVIMQKGRIYSLYLPAGKERYWDGKYLIFEGYGPQNVLGKSAHNNFLTYDALSLPSEDEDGYEYDVSMLGLQGNITFANYQTQEITFLPTKDAPIAAENKGYWYHFDKTAPGVMIRPGQVYAGMSKTDTDAAEGLNPMGIIRRVDITDEVGCPTIGEVVLYARAHDGVIQLISHAQQYVQVVSVDGQVIYAGMMHEEEEKRLSVTTGVYIVRSEEQAIKLLVQ